MKTTRLLLPLLPALLLCSCASTGSRVLATRHTTLHHQSIVAEYPVPVPDTTHRAD